MSRTFAPLHNSCGADLSKRSRTLTPEDREVLHGAPVDVHLEQAEHGGDGATTSCGTRGVILTATT